MTSLRLVILSLTLFVGGSYVMVQYGPHQELQKALFGDAELQYPLEGQSVSPQFIEAFGSALQNYALLDTDQDGSPDTTDTDIDNDGVTNAQDTDDDNDGVADEQDPSSALSHVAATSSADTQASDSGGLNTSDTQSASETGSAGTNGTTGSQGPVGANGTDGADGKDGEDGTVGVVTDDGVIDTTLTGSDLNIQLLLATCSGLTKTSTGLSLNTTCATNEILKWSGSAWLCGTDDGGITYTQGTGVTISAGVISAVLGTTIESAEITDGTVATGDLANGAVTNIKIADTSITLVKLASDSVNSAKIVDGTINSLDLGDGSITTIKIVDGAVTTVKVTDGAISSDKLADDSVTSAKIVNGTISTADISDANITAIKLSTDAVTSAKILDGTIASADLADGLILTAKLADGSVATAKLADNAVTTAKILDGTIINADVDASAAIALSKLADGSNIITSLGAPAGTNANGGSIASNVLTLSLADGTSPGLVSTGTQTFAGSKTLTGTTTFTGNISQTGATTFSSGTGANTLNGNVLISGSNTLTTGTGLTTISGDNSTTGNTTLAGYFATKKGADFSTVGSTNNASLGNASLIRMTGASAQTLTGIAGGTDGKLLTLVNTTAFINSFTNSDVLSLDGNRIVTGTGATLSIPAGGSVQLVYDSSGTVATSFWRVVGGTGGGSGGSSLPVVSTISASSVTGTTANTGGNITNIGGSAITASGVVWSTSGSPTLPTVNKTTDTVASGIFTSVITGLSANTIYFVRSYATNAAGTSYGEQITITTANPAGTTYSFTGGTQNYTVPAGVTSITVDVIGARGGNHFLSGSNGLGGYGARSQATIPVTPGANLTLVVGGQGQDSCPNSSANTSNGGSGGGGGSFLYQGSTPMVIAGGGGGGSLHNAGTPHNQGQNASTSTSGTSNRGGNAAGGAGPATGSGDLAGNGFTAVVSNPAAVGNCGGYGGGGNGAAHGGGGGGGYGGGGSTSNTVGTSPAYSAGGGGGGSFIMAGATSITQTAGHNSSGNGSINIISNSGSSTTVPGVTIGSTLDYHYVTDVVAASPVSVANNGIIKYLGTGSQVGNIPYSTSTGQWTLSANKTYVLEAAAVSNTVNGISYQWHNDTSVALVGSVGFTNGDNGTTGNQTQPVATYTFTPSVTTTVSLWNISGGARNFPTNAAGLTQPYAKITQLGSTTAFTGSQGVTLNNILSAIAAGTLDNTNYAQTWNWSTATTETALAMNFNALTSGNGLALASTSAGLTGNLLSVTSVSTSVFTNGAARFNFSGAHTGNGLQIDSGTLTGNAMQINANAITTGTGLNITSSYAAGNSTNGLLRVANTGAITTGTIFRAQSNSTTGSGLTVLANGRVGVGTASPASSLEVSGSSGDTALGNVNTHLVTINNTDTTNNNYSGIAFSNGAARYTQIVSRFDDHTGGSLDGSLHFFTTSNSTFANRMTITGDGNVGIGTTTPNAPLQFANTVVNRKVVLYEAANNDHQYYGLGINNSVLRYQVPETANHIFYGATSASASNELMRITATGNVGIANTNPTFPLMVGSAGSGFSVSNTATDPTTGSWIRTDGSNTVISTNVGDMYYGFGGNTGKLLRFGNDGARAIINSANAQMTLAHTATGNNTALTINTPGGCGTVLCGGIRIAFDAAAAGSAYIAFGPPGNTVGSVTLVAGGASVAYNIASDQRLKTDTGLDARGLESLLGIKVHNFNWNENGYNQDGFFAQELFSIVPDAVTAGSDEVDENGKLTNTWKVDYGRVTPLLVQSIQELNLKVDTGLEAETGSFTEVNDFLNAQQAQIVSLDTRVTATEDGLETLEERVATLEQNQGTTSGPEDGIFEIAVNFLEDAVFEKLAHFKDAILVQGPALFEDIVKFEGEVIFNKDAAGKVTVLAGESEVVIEFEGAYSTEPVITVTPNENTEVRYYVTNVTSQGFTLKVDPSVIEDTKFFWQAVRVDDSN